MDTMERAAVCTFDCPDTCSLTVTVEGDRVVKVRGSEAIPFTAGVVCNKVAQDIPGFVHGSLRLMHPLRRTGPKGSGQFERISWDAALDEIHARTSGVMRRWGPQAVMPLNYAGPHGLLAYDSMSLRFFYKLGATNLWRRALCGGVRAEAWAGMYGGAPGCPPEFAQDAQLNVVWGNNATVANLHLVRCCRIAKRKGGKLAVVDPLRTKIAEQADLHLALLPGTDVLLAWALAVELERMGKFNRAFIDANVLGLEEYMALAREWPVERAAAKCGIPAEQIRTFAQWLAESDPLVITPGNGLERGRNGGSGIRALCALPALLGKFGKGSGIAVAAGNSFPKTMNKLQKPELMPAGTRTLNINDIGKHLVTDDVDPPLRALFIYNHNPIVVHPDQNRIRKGLAREDVFSVGIDVAMTETMQHCDVVLPAATFLESDDIYAAYGHHWLQRGEPVIPPVGESLPNTEIFRRLAARFGFDDPMFKASDAELIDECIDPADRRLEGQRPSTIPIGQAVQMKAPDGKPMVLFENVRPATPSGKIELKSETLAQRWGDDALLPRWREREPTFPLMLISPASDKRISSSFGGLPRSRPTPVLMMHPDDAEKRNLSDGGEVRLWNERGEVFLPLEVTTDVPRGVVASEKGAWLCTSRNGQTISALVNSDMRADLAEGACFNDTLVEVSVA